jgi:serine protease Do
MLTRRRLALSALSLPFLSFPFASLSARAARAAAPAIIGKIRLTDNRVLIDAMIDGKGPFAFAIDTGAVVSGIRNDLLPQLGLKKLRDVQLNGGKSFPLYAVNELVLGGAVRQQGVALFGLEGRNLGADGMIAAGMVTNIDSELDFDRGEWRIYPNGGADRTGFTALPSELRDEPGANGSRRIYADVQLGDTVLRSLLDTGAPGVLSLENALGRRLGLWSDATPYVPIRTTGIAGADKSLARLVRAPRLRVGPADYDAPLVVVRPPGAIGDTPILGLPILRTLNLSIDHAAATVSVQRNSLPPKSPGYGGSGLWVDADGEKVRVAEVGIGSPAAKAGVRTGDVLEGVGGLRDAIGLLGGATGTTVALKLRRGGQASEVTFVLAAYL